VFTNSGCKIFMNEVQGKAKYSITIDIFSKASHDINREKYII